MKQVLFGYLNTVNFFNGIQGGMAVGSTIEANHQAIWPCTGVFRNLLIELATAPGAGFTRTFALRVNGVNTSLTFTISDTNTIGQSTGVDISINAGDYVCLAQSSTGTPSNSIARMSVEFEGTTAKESGYAQYLGPSANNAVARTTGAFSMHPTGAGAPTQTPQTLVAVDGVITKMYATAATNPGAGVGMTWYLNKNGVRQDGTSGTPNTGVAVIGVTSASRTFSLAVAPNDLMIVEGVSTGTFAAVNWSLSHNFIATTDLQSVLSGSSNSTLATQANMDVVIPPHVKNLTQNGSHIAAQYRMLTGISPVTLSGFRAWWQTAPGAGKTRRMVIEAGVDRLTGGTATGIVADLTGTGNYGSDLTHSYTTVTGTYPDALTIAFTNPAGTVIASAVSWGLIQTNPISVPTGPLASLGQTLANTTVESTSLTAVASALTRTLANTTVTATGDVDSTGTLTRTLSDATVTAITLVLGVRTAVVTQTLANVTVVAPTGVQEVATLARTLDAATLSSTAGILRDAAFTQTLANTTLTAPATVESHAALAQTFPNAAVSSTSVVLAIRVGAVALTLGDVAVTSTGIVIPVSGVVVVQTFENATVVSTAVATPISFGAVAQTLGAVTGTSTVTSVSATIVTRTLAAATVSGSTTTESHTALARTLGAATSSGAAGVTETATLIRNLGAAALAAVATLDSHTVMARTLGAATLNSGIATQANTTFARTLENATLASIVKHGSGRQVMGTIA